MWRMRAHELGGAVERALLHAARGEVASLRSCLRAVIDVAEAWERDLAPPCLTVEAIQSEVAGYFGVKLRDLKGSKRNRAVAHPRMVAMYLARRLTKMSYPEIGRSFGGKDHSTVISAVRKIDRLCGVDPACRMEADALEGRLVSQVQRSA